MARRRPEVVMPAKPLVVVGDRDGNVIEMETGKDGSTIFLHLRRVPADGKQVRRIGVSRGRILYCSRSAETHIFRKIDPEGGLGLNHELVQNCQRFDFGMIQFSVTHKADVVKLYWETVPKFVEAALAREIEGKLGIGKFHSFDLQYFVAVTALRGETHYDEVLAEAKKWMKQGWQIPTEREIRKKLTPSLF